MTDFVKRVFYRLTGGRPMERLECAFFDFVARKWVFLWRDRRDGTLWLSYGPWGIGRMKSIRQER